MQDNKTQNKPWRQKLNDFSELVMFQHSVFSLPFIFIAMIVASAQLYQGGWFGWKLLFLGVLAAISARNFAMGVNRYFDIDIDKLNPRTQNRPSVDGRVSQKQMIRFVMFNAVAFVVVAYFINTLALMLSVPILLVLGAYTLFKRFSSLAHLMLGVSLGLAPIAGDIAVSATVHLWSLYLAIGVAFWVAGFDLLYSLQDITFDKIHGLHSIPSKFGVSHTMWLAKGFHLVSLLFWSLFTLEASLGSWGFIAVFIAFVLLSYEHYLIHQDFKKINKAFFVVNGYLGFIYLGCIIIEVAL